MSDFFAFIDTTADHADRNVGIALVFGAIIVLLVAAIVMVARDLKPGSHLDRALICGPRNPVDTGCDEYQEAFDKHTADALAIIASDPVAEAERILRGAV